MKKYFRSKVNGMIFDYKEMLIGNQDLEVVTEAEAYPERLRPKATVNVEAQVDISVPKEIREPANEAPEALRQEATARFSKPASNKIKTKNVDVAGLVGEF